MYLKARADFGRLAAPLGIFLRVGHPVQAQGILLGGSWDLVSKVKSTLIGVISSYKYSYLIYNPTY